MGKAFLGVKRIMALLLAENALVGNECPDVFIISLLREN